MAFELTSVGGVKFFRSSYITCPHGFSTRIGGVSEHSHTSSLNLAFGRGDDDNVVLENLKLFSNAVGVNPKSIVSRTQIHSNIVEYVDTSNVGEGYFKDSTTACDGYITNKSNVTLGIKTADCVPILFYDDTANIIGAVHAGWRGTAAMIAAVCVKKMTNIGAVPKNIKVAIGAAINFCCYEVNDDFYDSVANSAGKKYADKFIKFSNGKLHADIVGFNKQILREVGVENIDISQHCTCHEPELFYSHRYSKGNRGTMLSIISLP